MITNANFPETGGHAEITILIPRRADGSHNYAAAFASLSRAVCIEPDAFDATHHAELALAAGEPATGGGASSQAMPSEEHAPDPDPATAALIERAEAADDTRVGSLLCGADKSQGGTA